MTAVKIWFVFFWIVTPVIYVRYYKPFTFTLKMEAILSFEKLVAPTSLHCVTTQKTTIHYINFSCSYTPKICIIVLTRSRHIHTYIHTHKGALSPIPRPPTPHTDVMGTDISLKQKQGTFHELYSVFYCCCEVQNFTQGCGKVQLNECYLVHTTMLFPSLKGWRQ
jgi:hypothetical protein